MAKSEEELFALGFQDGQYHTGNAADQTTPEERDRRTHGAAYKHGYNQGTKDRREYLTSQGRQK